MMELTYGMIQERCEEKVKGIVPPPPKTCNEWEAVDWYGKYVKEYDYDTPIYEELKTWNWVKEPDYGSAILNIVYNHEKYFQPEYDLERDWNKIKSADSIEEYFINDNRDSQLAFIYLRNVFAKRVVYLRHFYMRALSHQVQVEIMDSNIDKAYRALRDAKNAKKVYIKSLD